MKQFTPIAISLEVASRLVGGNSKTLQYIYKSNNEHLLETGAKLIYLAEHYTFAVFGYNYDLSDAIEALDSVDALTDENYVFGGNDHDDQHTIYYALREDRVLYPINSYH